MKQLRLTRGGRGEYDRARTAAKAICEEDSNDESDDELSICIPDGTARRVKVLPEEPRVVKSIQSEDKHESQLLHLYDESSHYYRG